MEDVQYLQAHSRTDSHLAFIDSATRDTRIYPTASRFEVVFDTPFNMVYGIDLLGVNAPRTEYTVSGSRNQLVMSYGEPGVNQQHVVTVPEGDYDTLSFVAALNTALGAFRSSAGNTISVSPLTPTASVSNKLQFTCAERFTLYLSSSPLRVVVGFADPVNDEQTDYRAPGWSAGRPDTITSTLFPPAGAALKAFDGASGQADSHVPVLAFKPLEQVFIPELSGMVTNVTAGFTATGKPTQPYITWQILTISDGVCVGTGQFQVNLDSSTTDGGWTTATAALTAGVPYRLVMLDDSNGDSSNCFNVSTSQSGPGFTVGSVAHTGSLFVSVDTQLPLEKVIAPGLLDLTGERYIVLRCLEIESPINKSRAFERWTSGVGMIQLGTFGYTNNSYDYTSYPSRTFDPIGSLSKLTLSCHKADGSLYDFKGLNLSMQLLIKFLVPITPGPNRRANPQYTPHLPEAISRRLQEEIDYDPRYRWMPRGVSKEGFT